MSADELSVIREDLREGFERLHQRLDEIARTVAATRETQAAHEARLKALEEERSAGRQNRPVWWQTVIQLAAAASGWIYAFIHPLSRP